MKRVFHYIIVALWSVAALITSACSAKSGKEQPSDIAVTILPLKYIVESITDNDFKVEVMVSKGASPETYEPTPKQLIKLNESQMIFSTGLIDFENALLGRIENQKAIINLSKGISLIEGSCSHNHAYSNSHTHAHGIDPHIWTSPRELKIMAKNAYDAIMQHYPDSAKYHTAYKALVDEFDQLDKQCEQMCHDSKTEAFVVYHPALTYFARAYGIEQIAVESDGKEPSAKHLAHIIDDAKAKNARCILYQVQYPRSVVEVVAKDMGCKCIEFDPLEENITENILHITHTITGIKQ